MKFFLRAFAAPAAFLILTSFAVSAWRPVTALPVPTTTGLLTLSQLPINRAFHTVVTINGGAPFAVQMSPQAGVLISEIHVINNNLACGQPDQPRIRIDVDGVQQATLTADRTPNTYLDFSSHLTVTPPIVVAPNSTVALSLVDVQGNPLASMMSCGQISYIYPRVMTVSLGGWFVLAGEV